MDRMATECAAQSVGPANQLFSVLIQTILAAQCSISPPNLWPEDYGKRFSAQENEYDFVVIGAGSAGSVVASRLSEYPDWKVLLLEAGGDPPIESEIPSTWITLQHTQSDWEFYAESDSACQAYKGGCFWPRGKLLGGSSAINAMVYVRGTPRDFNRWAELGNPTWNYENALKYLKKSEGNRDPELVKYMNGKYHNDKGPVFIERMGNELQPLSNIIIQANQELGANLIDDINGDKTLGVFHSQSFTFNGRRQSTTKAFLVPAKNRTNLHIIKHAHVQKILIDDNNVATGVQFRYKNDQIFKATIRKEVILSAGAVSSPQILMLSGIGPKEHLKKHNIKVKHDSAVGKNLLDHISAHIFFKFPSLSSQVESHKQILDAIYNLAIHNSGPLSSLSAGQMISMINTVNGTGEPDIQLHYLTSNKSLGLLKSYIQTKEFSKPIEQILNQAVENSDMIAVLPVLLQPKSSGFIELKSTSPDDKPKIVPNYFSDDEDRETMIRAVKHVISFTETDVFRKNKGELIRLPIKECDQLEYKSDDYWRCYLRHISSTLYHPVGTSKMGPDSDAEAVVDSRLNVRGVKRLRQIDAGIMPELVSANTNAATIMIGERGADFIKEDYLRKLKTEL